MMVLALNCGSSSLKFQLLKISARSEGGMQARCLARGRISFGSSGESYFQKCDESTVRNVGAALDHASGVESVCKWLEEISLGKIDSIGHRIVHGGAAFAKPTVIDDSVMRSLETLTELAPLHNRPAIAAIDACRRRFGELFPMVAVFDTSFHANLPEHARRYAIPEELAAKHGFWRFGFHGLAHRWMMERYTEITRQPIAASKLITLQLGSGSSAAAILKGRSVETSMGLSPLEGLIMSTRCGDVDPSLPGLLMEREGLSAAQVEEILNTRSGLLGIHGRIKDLRELLEAAKKGDARAALAVAMFCHRVKKFIGAYLTVLEGADAIIFGGGIGENLPGIRSRICSGMKWCGIELDEDSNTALDRREIRISKENSAIQVYVIPVNEEELIARDTYECLRRAQGEEMYEQPDGGTSGKARDAKHAGRVSKAQSGR
jgi:acetate kinase